jgi:hypothetical protein
MPVNPLPGEYKAVGGMQLRSWVSTRHANGGAVSVGQRLLVALRDDRRRCAV